MLSGQITTNDLLKRGWTDAQITLLPPPMLLTELFGPIYFWHIDDVISIEKEHKIGRSAPPNYSPSH